MTEERRYGINWVDLIIKVILLVLFVLLIVWLFPMPKLDTFYDKVFNDNIQTMKSAAREYFTVDRLPEKIGETKTMSLEQLLNNKLILDFSDKNGNACDTKNSYVQVTKTLDSEYALKVSLTCGDETDYIIDTIGCNGTCLLSDVNNADKAAKTTDDKDTDDEYTEDVKFSGSKGKNSKYNGVTSAYYNPFTTTKNTSGTNTHTSTTTTIYKNNTSSSDNTSQVNNKSTVTINRKEKTAYYEQAKVRTSYGNWVEGYGSGNVDRKTEKVDYYYYTRNNGYNNRTSEYRTTSWLAANEYYNGKSYSYELQLTDIPSSVNNVSMVTNRYFYSNDYAAYINNRNSNVYMSGNDMLSNTNNRNASTFANSALKSNNFTYSLSNPYKTNGVWRVRVYISIRNNSYVPAYYDSYLNRDIYFVPVYFKVSYGSAASNRVLDTAANSYKYSGYTRTYAYSDTKYYHRTLHEYVDYDNTKWSTSRYLDGYKFTGNIRYN